MAVSAEDKKRVKGMGFLNNRGTDRFSGRIITENGVLTGEQLRHIGEAAERFGNGQVAFTARLTVELPGIAYEDIEPFRAFLAEKQLETGGTGNKVRPVVACKGTVCVFGLYDTQAMAAELHKRFYEGYGRVTLPHKFKIAAGGCPNNCLKPDLNDVGIIGQRAPAFDSELCRGCKKCGVSAACPIGAASLEGGALRIDGDACNNCGRCAGQCPFGANPESEVMFKITLGGRWGKQIRQGTALSPLFTYSEAMETVERAILLFRDLGRAGERFGSLIDRLGMEETERLLLAPELLLRKEAILAQEIGEGAARWEKEHA